MGDHASRSAARQGGSADILQPMAARRRVGQGGTMGSGSRLLIDGGDDRLIGLADKIGKIVAERIQTGHIQHHPGQHPHPRAAIHPIVVPHPIQVDVGTGQTAIDRCIPEQGIPNLVQTGLQFLLLTFGAIGRKGGDPPHQDAPKNQQHNRHLQQGKTLPTAIIPASLSYRRAKPSVHGAILPARCSGSLTSAGANQMSASSPAPCR